METEKYNKEAELINNTKKELQESEGLGVDIHSDSLKATLKNVLNGKTPCRIGIQRFWF